MDTGLYKMKNKLESAVIVTNKYASIATIRFTNKEDDKIISSTTKPVLYSLVEKHIKQVLRKPTNV